MVNQGSCRFCSFNGCRGIKFIIALDEGPLFANLNLNGTRLACGVGLFNFAGRFFNQCDFFAFTSGSAVAGLQIA